MNPATNRARLFRPLDFLVMALVVALALLLFLLPHIGAGEPTCLVVSVDGVETPYSLAGEYSFTVTSRGYTLTVRVADGSAAVIASDCEEEVCLHTPAISRTGEVILCTKSRVMLRIAGGGEGYDAVTG